MADVRNEHAGEVQPESGVVLSDCERPGIINVPPAVQVLTGCEQKTVQQFPFAFVWQLIEDVLGVAGESFNRGSAVREYTCVMAVREVLLGSPEMFRGLGECVARSRERNLDVEVAQRSKWLANLREPRASLRHEWQFDRGTVAERSELPFARLDLRGDQPRLVGVIAYAKKTSKSKSQLHGTFPRCLLGSIDHAKGYRDFNLQHRAPTVQMSRLKYTEPRDLATYQ